MSDLTIITNNHPREILYGGIGMTPEERAEFDYIDWVGVESGQETAEFVRYKGQLYDLNDTEGTFPPDQRWFYISDSFFSGVLFRYPHATRAGHGSWDDDYGLVDTEHIICGRYFA